MKPNCEFSSEVLQHATYKITEDKFEFTKRHNHWVCTREEIGDFIDLLIKAMSKPSGYNLPPIKVKGTHRIIHIDVGDNHFIMNEALTKKFLEELKMVYEVYG